MSRDAFKSRSDALENEFFAKMDQQLLHKLRCSAECEEFRNQLGLSDQVAQSLMAAGVTLAAAAALRIVPLAAVAWADRVLESSEREVILAAAAKHGIPRNEVAGQLLDKWLTSPPPQNLLENWIEYTKALIKQMDSKSADDLRSSILSEIRQVAEASGGILGWGAISSTEGHVIKVIESALQSTAS